MENRTNKRLAGPLLAFATLCAAGCTDAKQAVLARACSSASADYEAASRPRFSTATGINTEVEVAPTAQGDCCIDERFLVLTEFTPALPKDAVVFPWKGRLPASDVVGQAIDQECNSCPYGIQEIQGEWVDTDRGMPLTFTESFMEVVNRIIFDGNTFRWQAKHKLSGQWLDFRGFYFCSSTGGTWLLPLHVDRGSSAPCEPVNSANVLWNGPYDRIEVGLALPAGINAYIGAPPGNSIFEALHVNTAQDDEHLERFFCKPGSTIGVSPDPSQIRSDCPTTDVFLECWDTK